MDLQNPAGGGAGDVDAARPETQPEKGLGAEGQAETPPGAGQDRRGSDQRGGDRRRSALDRRMGLDRRRGPGRRRSDERRSAEEGQMTDEQFELLMAIEKYRRLNNRPFPTWTEVLDIIHALGYRKVAEPQDIR